MKKIFLTCINAVTKKRTNKYYNMFENTNDTFSSIYGTIGETPKTKIYPISNWDEIYNNKTQKEKNGHIYIEENESER